MAIVHRDLSQNSTTQTNILQIKSPPLPSSLHIPNMWMSGSYGSGKTHSFMAILYPHLLLQEYEDGIPIIGERLDNLCILAETLHGEYQTRKMLLDCGAIGATLQVQQLQLHKIENGGLMLLDLMKEASSS